MHDWDVRTSGRPDVRTSERPDVRTFSKTRFLGMYFFRYVLGVTITQSATHFTYKAELVRRNRHEGSIQIELKSLKLKLRNPKH